MITAIIQARTGSTRLPNKAMLSIEGRPMLWHLIDRAHRAKSIEKIVIATTRNPRDKAIIEFAKENNIEVYRGSEEDVLDRMYKAAKEAGAGTIVRITPDCPLLSPDIIDKVVTAYKKGRYDYVTNTLYYTYPDGCDVEVFSFAALERAWRECKDPSKREHVTSYIKHSGKFRLKNVENESPLDPREYKWSVDRPRDLEFVRKVYEHLYAKKRIFGFADIMELLKKRPEIKEINSGSVMNEGAYRSIVNSADVKPKRITLKKSRALKKKTERLIPLCSQTLSKSPSQYVGGVSPVFLERGAGSHVWDVDGNEFIEYIMGLGPVILGYAYPAVNKAVRDALGKGVTFTLPHRMEGELASLLCGLIPCAEMVRFGKNGSDVTSAAVRLARAFTGRDIIVCSGYHGWHDWYTATTSRREGVPEGVSRLTKTFEYNNIKSLERLFTRFKDRIACVIMEPVSVTAPESGFLKKVKEITHRNGALLIFDEVVTGFRFSLGGAQEYFGVIPDLACFGKAMANGFPISALVGKRNIMSHFDRIFYSLTFGGEIGSIAASLATIKELKEKNCLLKIWELGRRLKDGYNTLSSEYGLTGYTGCLGYPPRNVITFKDSRGRTDLLLKSLFQQECIRRGVLAAGSHNISYSHSHKDVDYTLRVYNTVLKIMKRAIDGGSVKKMLKGEPIEPVFRKI